MPVELLDAPFSTLVAPQVAPTTGPPVTYPATATGNHDKFHHIVLEGFWKDDEHEDFVPTGHSVVEGIIERVPVKALCGKLWVPGEDVKKYALCGTCKDIAEKRGWKVPTL